MSKRMMFAWGFLIISLLTCFSVMGIMTEKENADYVKLQNELIEASKIYIDQENIELSKNDSYEIDINDLLKKGYIDTLKVNDDTCEGTILAITNDGKNSFEAHIKCGKYESLEN